MNDTIRVLMIPQLKWFRREESGIKRVVEALNDHLPAFGVRCVEEGMAYDMSAGHAGMLTNPTVAHIHGLYWTADYPTDGWEYRANRDVIEALRNAKEIIVPSEWVAETIRRDMYRQPHVIGHGIDWDDWQHDYIDNRYILWNKNRAWDVCDPRPVAELASRFPEERFVTTFAPKNAPVANVQTIGLQPHETMKKLVQGASMYLSTTKETFGIGVLEAMAAGIPVLGFAWGGNLDLVEHGVSGYLAQPGNFDDLADGLRYCRAHRAVLGANAREQARLWTWERCAEKTAAVYRQALVEEPPLVTVVIPCYNYAATVGRAIESILGQTHELLECIVVDDGSSEDIESVVRPYLEADRRVKFIRQRNMGVAHARNNGIEAGRGKYACCLDADDAIDRRFLQACVEALEADAGLHLAYTGLWSIQPDGREGKSPWPGPWDFTAQSQRKNQVPTCCVFRRQTFRSLGGYRQKYAPMGAGSEDADLWYRFGAAGFRCAQVTHAPLFIYSLGTGRVSGNPKYHEVDWLQDHPEINDGQHPFASFVKPRRFSHPVRQYDQPSISVIIPVGPGHEEDVREALDSLPAQTMRRWEAVIIWDAGGEAPEALRTAYPWGRWGTTGEKGGRGAGVARNMGRQLSRAPLLLFLDADDWLEPRCLERMLDEWQMTGCAVYSDYYGRAFVDDMSKLAPDLRKRVRSHNERTNETVLEYTQQEEYNWERAQQQPNPDHPYLWCNVTTLLPTAWFDEVGGFDESMVSWEDVDLWWRLARRGKCFFYIREPLLTYRFYTGKRRDALAADNPEVAAERADTFAYLRNKYAQEGEPMPCSGCGKSRTIYRRPSSVARSATSPVQVEEVTMNEKDLVLCRYVSPNVGDHHVTGRAAFPREIPGINMVHRGGDYFIDYGYRAGGGVEKFLVHRADIKAQPHLFQEITLQPVAPPPTAPPPPPVSIPKDTPPTVLAESDEIEGPPRPEPPPDVEMPDIATGLRKRDAPPAPKPLDPVFELQKLPGMNADTAEFLNAEYGVQTPSDILELGRDVLDNLPKPHGISKRRAGMIFRASERIVNGDDATS